MLQPMSLFLALLFLLLQVNAAAQTITQKLATAFALFENDPQLQNALASLYVIDANGNIIFQKDANTGLAPASTQKIITSATAYELLGKSFRYKTAFGFIKNKDATTQLYIKGSGDPTLGSFRWEQTREEAVLKRIVAAAPNVKISNTVVSEITGWDNETISGGWMWDDIGNYYGAGAGVFNWLENQYDVFMRSGGSVGNPVVITGTQPRLANYKLVSKVLSAAKGSGDNAYIYFPLAGDSGTVRGTIPVGESRFVISGALPNPVQQFATTVLQRLRPAEKDTVSATLVYASAVQKNVQYFHTETSPPLDSIIYWFNKRSINLYGEALLKTIAFQNKGNGSTETGVGLLKTFWKSKGIPETALNLVDGSGLSPLNRVTTQAQVAVLQYAKKQDWFPGFYIALPEYNGMKLKSGTIHGVKGFAGYHTSKDGTSYILSFLVNNYNGAASTLVKKMYAVLDVLK